MNGHSEQIEHLKKGTWSWRPVRVAGQNRIAVYRGRRLVTLLGPHEVDDAHALVGMRNQAAGGVTAGQGGVSRDTEAARACYAALAIQGTNSEGDDAHGSA